MKIDRRNFLKMMGVTAVAASAPAIVKGIEKDAVFVDTEKMVKGPIPSIDDRSTMRLYVKDDSGHWVYVEGLNSLDIVNHANFIDVMGTMERVPLNSYNTINYERYLNTLGSSILRQCFIEGNRRDMKIVTEFEELYFSALITDLQTIHSCYYNTIETGKMRTFKEVTYIPL